MINFHVTKHVRYYLPYRKFTRYVIHHFLKQSAWQSCSIFSKNFTHTNTWTFTVFILKWVILQILIFTYNVLLNFVTVCFPTVCKNPTYTVNWNKWEHHTESPWRYLEWDLVWRSVLTYMYLSLFRTNTNRWIILDSKV